MSGGAFGQHLPAPQEAGSEDGKTEPRYSPIYRLGVKMRARIVACRHARKHGGEARLPEPIT